MRFGRHPRALRGFVRRHRARLGRLPSAFVPVSGAAAADAPERREEARRYSERFPEKTGWTPDRTLCAAGALAFTQYNPLLRRMMKWISQRSGRSIDTSRDHEHTVWAEVESFARESARSVAKERPGRSPAAAEERG